MSAPLLYLGMPLKRPRVAIFDFTACEGCELQLLNNEGTLLDFLSLFEIVSFREGMTGHSDEYDIALVEGSITRGDEVERLKKIRANAKVLVALGTCACFGGVNQLKNRFNDLDWVKRQVYGDTPIDTDVTRPLEYYVPVDLKIYGCPIKKEEVERIVLDLVLGKSVTIPAYPVCMECKANGNICLYDLGEPCLGPVTRAGCGSWCPNSRWGCWGCRGPAEDANLCKMISIMRERGISTEAIVDRLECFGGFSAELDVLRASGALDTPEGDKEMKISANVNVHHLTRVEGHGNIQITIKDGKVLNAKWEVVETPRFFEAMLVGKHWENAPWICGRICGICSIGHTLASIRAIENAFGIVPTEQTARLRLLLKHMETLQSHILHLYFLAAPDFVGTGSVLPLIESHPDVVKRAAGLKLLANDICDLIGGRRLHPTTTVVGGFTMLPDKRVLDTVRTRLKDSVPDLIATAELFKTFKIPGFTRETEFVSLKGEGAYPFIGGDLVSSDGVVMEERDYRKMTNEYTVPQSTSKWSKLSRESFAVGALARLNNNYRFLHPMAREVAGGLGLAPVNHNPFMNNVAQLVECVHVVAESIDMIGALLGSEWIAPRAGVEPRDGAGVGAVEVPRGILYHCYEFDKKGKIRACDCVIPTSQNHANIQHDLTALASWYSSQGSPDREIELLASMLVRAYDPCISCSVH